VLRTSLGGWINYATTFIAQVIFATKFGSSSGAAAYTLVFSILTGASSMVTNTVQSVLVPRMLDASGRFLPSALRKTAYLLAVAVALAGLTILWSDTLSDVLRDATGLSAGGAALVRSAALAASLQAVAGILISAAIARGFRFGPGLAPAAPSVAVGVALLAMRDPTVGQTLDAFVIGSAIECALLGLLVVRGAHLGAADADERLIIMVLGTFGQFVLLALVAPLERAFVSASNVHDVARYDYATKSLVAGQTLLVGGAVLAGLGGWSALHRTGRLEELQRSVGRVVLMGTGILCVAAAVALPVMTDLVSVVFEHGEFTARDTEVVAAIVAIELPAFVLFGAMNLMTSALAAGRRSWELVALGVAMASARIAFAAVGARLGGVYGVAAGYSIATLLLAPVTLRLVRQRDLWPASWPVPRLAYVGGLAGVLVTSGVVSLLPLPGVAGAGLVAVAAGVVVATAWQPLFRGVGTPQ
jgi:hypothetical protein